MEETLDRELARATRHDSSLGLIMLDIDNFKHFNDEFGHRAGDNALVEVGALLAKVIRTEDVACRYGGEEFAVIMPGAPLEATTRRAAEIGRAIRGIVIQDAAGALLSGLSASMGVAVFPDHGDGCDALVRAADQALFAAKQAGRDCVRVAEAVAPPPKPPEPAGEAP
jgi:diguanylate cyclase (GGDEF)-like protein